MAATAVDCKTGKGSTDGSGRKGRAGPFSPGLAGLFIWV